jgi:hypothetical protein
MAFSRQAVVAGAMCGAFVTLTLVSFAAALIGRLRGAAPPEDPLEYGGWNEPLSQARD